MIRIIQGMPGSGKGLFAVRQLVEELRTTKRHILTNLDVDIGRINEFVQERWPDENCCAVERIHRLQDEEVRAFWMHRGHGNGLVEVVDKNSLKFTDTRGVCYLIDETQNFFNSRAWQETGRHCLFYLSQHRHLGDVVWLCTQSVKNIDAQMRSLAQDTFQMRNYTLERRGLFRGPAAFRWASWMGGQPGPMSDAVASGFFRLDVDGYASCYSTAGGVGIASNAGADKGEARKGLPFWVMPAGMVAAGLLVVLGVWKGLPAVASGMVPKMAGLQSMTTNGVTKPVQTAPAAPVVVPVPVPAAPVVPVPAKSLPQSVETEVVSVVGYSTQGSKVRVWFDDGTEGSWPVEMFRQFGAGIVLDSGRQTQFFPMVRNRKQPEVAGGGQGR